MSEKPFIIRNLLNQQTHQPESIKLYFDAIYPSHYANGELSNAGSAIAVHNPNWQKGSRLIISSAEYFIVRQLWPEYCAVDEQAALELIYPRQQLSLFDGFYDTT